MSNISSSNLKIKINLKCLFIVFVLLALVVLEVLYNGSYLDEIIGILSLAYIIVSAKRLVRSDMITIVLLCIVIAVGLFSNLIFRINSSAFSILVDVLTQIKLIFAFYAVKYFLNTSEKITVANMLVPIAKLFCIVTLVCAVITQFADIGMSTGEVRYGITVFKFIFGFNHQYTSTYMLVFGTLVCNTAMSEKLKRIYYVIALISILFATKSPALMFTVVFVFLGFYFRKHDKISVQVLIPMIVVLIFAGTYQINEYLLNESSPRYLFFEYAFKTANEYFPLGSGFATYGSEQAARVYSPLYYEYGFDKLWGLSPEEGFFLNDNYWPTVIGQFGWIGAAVMIVVYARVFLTFANKKIGNVQKAFLYAVFAQYMIHAIGSAILTNSCGMIGFISLALFSVTDDTETPAIKLPRVKIRI